MWLLAAIYFLNALVTYGIFLWLPRILRESSGLDGFALSAITAVPFAAALVGMVVIGRHSDCTGERKWHVAACAFTAAAGLLVAVTFQSSLPLLVLGFTLSQLGQRSILSVFWAIPPMFLGGAAAAAGIALINSIGNLGGAVGPSVMGWLREDTSSYSAGLLVLAGVPRSKRSWSSRCGFQDAAIALPFPWWPEARFLPTPAPAVQGIVGRLIIVSYNFVVSAIMSDNNVGSTP